MARLHVGLFRLAYALAAAAYFVVLLPLLWQARFSEAVQLNLPFGAAFYVTANLMFARYRVASVHLRRRSLYAAERAMQAFLQLSMGTLLLFACNVLTRGHTDAIAGTGWLLPICAIPLYFLLRAGVAMYFALDALARRYFGTFRLRRFVRGMR